MGQIRFSIITTEGKAMTNEIRQMMIRQSEMVDQQQAAYLAVNQNTPRYCYTCQKWLGGAVEAKQHPEHSIH